MKRRYKILSFFAFLFVMVYFCVTSTESVVRKLVNQYGSKFLGTDVSLEGVELSPLSGKASFQGLRIANPKGYKAPDLFYLQKISLHLDLKSLLNHTVVVHSIEIDKPEFTYEMLSLNQNNISDLLNHLQSNNESSEIQPAQALKQNTPNKKTAKKVIIQNFVVREGKVSAMAGLSSLKKEFELPLPTIQLRNIGQEKQGFSVAQAIKTVLQEVLRTVSNTALQGMSGLKDFGKASLDQVKDVAQGLQNQAKEDLKGKLKNLFH